MREEYGNITFSMRRIFIKMEDRRDTSVFIDILWTLIYRKLLN